MYSFSKYVKNGKMWNVEEHIDGGQPIGPNYFSFDKKTIFNFWPDYPQKLTDEQIVIFMHENSYWANFRKDETNKRLIKMNFIDKKLFDYLIKESMGYNYDDCLSYDGYPEYLNKDYADKLYKYIKKNKNRMSLLDLEFQHISKRAPDVIKICSVASSSRLALLYFENLMLNSDTKYIFEKKLPHGVKGNSPSLDAWQAENNIYYECKCHEIFDVPHKRKLKVAYKNKLAELFNLNGIITDSQNEFFDVKLSDIKPKNFYKHNKNELIYNLHLDVKQLICHLIGIQNCNKNKKATLQYIFFTPSKKYWNPEIEKLYDDLSDEWDMILNSKAFVYFLESNKNISIKYKYVDVGKIKDLVM